MESFEQPLQIIRLRRRLALWLFVLFLPWGVLVLSVLPGWVALALVIAWGVAWLVFLVLWGRSVCPRCGRWFFAKTVYGRTRAFSDACVHCDLPI